jgi:hypothetical protein
MGQRAPSTDGPCSSKSAALIPIITEPPRTVAATWSGFTARPGSMDAGHAVHPRSGPLSIDTSATCAAGELASVDGAREPHGHGRPGHRVAVPPRALRRHLDDAPQSDAPRSRRPRGGPAGRPPGPGRRSRATSSMKLSMAKVLASSPRLRHQLVAKGSGPRATPRRWRSGMRTVLEQPAAPPADVRPHQEADHGPGHEWRSRTSRPRSRPGAPWPPDPPVVR